MAASATDKVRKKKSLFQTTLNGGIGSGDASLTLQSASGLPTDTGVTIVINRVDANGVSTPSAMEVVTGVVSGSTVGSLVRAEDGTTAKSHANASVVEMVWDAETWNDFCDAYLSEHNQDGTHKAAALATPINAASSKATPVDADRLVITDSAASYVLKQLTWANLKATLKTYFDTLYGALTGNNTWSGTNTFTGIVIAKLNLPEGSIVNGKISPTVASNNLTLALKGLDGNDPSASNPVYVVLNGVVRSVTSALSVTKNAGTNYMDLGSAVFASLEQDLFAYLGYNSTDGVVIGFSRICHGRQYSDFSTTATVASYCAISTITNAASTDYYTVVGRFAATLGVSASYNWSVPTYTAINLIQRPIYETRWLAYSTNRQGNGGTAPTYTSFDINRYKLMDARCRFFLHWSNESGGTAGSGAQNLTGQVPFPYKAANYGDDRGCLGFGETMESAGTMGSISLHADNTVSTTAFRFKLTTTQVNLTNNDQSSTQRFICAQGDYEIA